MSREDRTDEELVVEALREREAFGALVERHRHAVWQRCRARVRDRQHAEDLAQDAFVSAFLRLRQLRDPARFAAWLGRIADNLCLQFMRRERAVACAAVEPATEQSATSTAHLGGAALARLSGETLRCLELAYEGRLSCAEIGLALGMSEGAVKTRLYRARARLREEPGAMEGANRAPFTERVMRKLETLETGEAEERAQAVRTLRHGVADTERERVVSLLRHHATAGAGIEDEGDGGVVIGQTMRRARRFPSAEVRGYLEAILLTHPFEETRVQAASALIAQRDPAAIPALRRAAEDPANPQEVVAAARSAIKQLEGATGPTQPRKEAAKLYEDLDPARTDPAARRALVRRFAAALDDPSPAVRSQAAQALLRLGDKRAAGSIARLLTDPVPGVREAAAGVLGDLGGRQAVQPLIRALAGVDSRSLQAAILVALTKLGDARALPAVLDAAAAGDDTLFVLAVRDIAAIADADSLPLLGERTRVWREGPPGLRRGWAERVWADALARLGEIRDVPAMAAALAACPWHEHLPGRLAEVGGQEAVRALSVSVRAGNHHAAAALLRMGPAGTVAIRGMLQEPVLEARLAVLRGVTFGGAEAVRGAAADAALVARLKELAAVETDRSAKLFAGTALRRLRKAVD